MPEFAVCSRSPELVPYLTDGNLVFYGAADLGKSLVVEEADQIQRVEQLRDLADPVSEYVALDDIYAIYQEYVSTSNSALQDRFEAVLAREYGVCLVTRPRSLDWLLTNTEFGTLIDIHDFTFLARQYTEDEAVEAAIEIASDLTPEDIRDHIDRLAYRYEFEYEAIEEYQTFIPQLVLRSSVLADRGALFPGDFVELSRDGILGTLRGFAADFSESIGFNNISMPSTGAIADAGSIALSFIQDYESVYHDIVHPFLEENQESIGKATASIVRGVGAGAVPVVGPLVVSALLRPDGTAQSREAAVDFFGGLVDDELLPPTRCQLEEEMDAPPMTIEYLRTVTRPAFHAQLTNLIDADIDYIEDIAIEVQAEVEELHQNLNSLSERVSIIEAFISARTQDAVESVDALRVDLEALERQYLQVDDPVPIDELTLQNVDLDERYRRLRRGTPVHVLRGPHGTGKTTVAYRLCRRLAGDEYTVRIPRFGVESRSFVRNALEGIEGPVAVFASYRVGAFSVDDAAEIIFLLELLDMGTIDILLIECRDEVFGQLDDRVRSRTANARVSSNTAELWRFKEVFALPPVETTGIEAVATWVGEIKGEPDAVRQELRKIVEIAGNNPEVAKIAARMVCESQDLSEIQTEDELLWFDIQNITAARSDAIESAQRSLVKWLAVSGGMSREELRAISEIRRDVFAAALENLTRYVQQSEEVYSLIPDVYQEIIFREECLDQLDHYVPTLVEEGLEEHLADVALNVTVCANIQQRDSYPGLADRCVIGAEVVLSELLAVGDVEQLYYGSLQTLATTDLPVSPSVIGPETLVGGIVDQIDVEANDAVNRGHSVYTTDCPEEWSLDVLEVLAGNYILTGDQTALDEFIDIMVEVYDQHQQLTPSSSGVLDYRGETVYDHEFVYLMECLGMSFERLTECRDIARLEGDVEMVRDVVLAHDELPFPFPDPSAQSRSVQTTAMLYRYAISGMASVENDPAFIESLLSRIHEDLQQAFAEVDGANTPLQAFSEEDWLSRVYALFVKVLMYHHQFELVNNWPSAIESHVNATFSPEKQCEFYKYVVESAGTRAEMEPRPGWLIWILEHEGILGIALDDELDSMVFGNSHELMRALLATCLGVFRRVNLPEESAQLHDLLESQTAELDDNFARLYRAVVEDLGSIVDSFDERN